MMKNVVKFVTSRPLGVVTVLALVVIIVGCIPITIWHKATDNITNDLTSSTQNLRSSLLSEIDYIGNFIYPKTNSSTISLTNVIDSSLTNNITNFSVIETQIAPVLFQAYMTIPQVSQVSYISTNGFLFSYMTELNTCVAVFANSSSNSSGGDYTWYVQTVDKLTGKLEGSATKAQPLDVVHAKWFQAAIENYTTSFAGTGLRGEDKETLFQSVVSLNNKEGVVSLGFPVKTLSDALNGMNLHGGELYVWTEEGTLLVREGSLNASSFISNGSICFGQESKTVQSQYLLDNCNSSGCHIEIESSKFQAFCSVLEVSGVSLRYTLMFPNREGGTSIMNTAMYLLITTMVLYFLYSIGFVAFMVKAAGRERDMRATLINQMEATQQAERKSMNKSQAFASASHDIRGSLAGISGLVDLCRQEVKPGSELDTNLKQVNACTSELFELLNSVLDMSKIESGKMQLDEEDFNLTNLLEDVIDFFHPVAMKKGVEVVLDLQDGSLFKFANVRGDSGKLKQILNNLVSNAVKFTVEGHITIRAWAQRPSSKSSVSMASDHPKGGGGGGGVVSKFSKYMLGKNKDQSSSNKETETIRNNANTMEFVFEVDDTGKGVPMEMRKSVFENYVQVRETAKGQQGTGLGLGIVQSLVRLMGGEIRITDKPMGEKGTCFQFNVLLKTSEAPTSEMKMESGGDNISTPNLGLTINTSLGSNMNLRNLSPKFNNCLISSPKQVGSRVVLLLKDDERRRVTEKYIKSLGIKVTTVEKWEHLSDALERLPSPHSSMGRAERNESSSPSSKDLPLIGIDGIDSRSQVPKKRSNSFYGYILLVIDAKAGPISELQDIVEQFRRGLHHNITCKVVWLNAPSANGSGDVTYLKPLHGSRLNRVLKMLPEFGGAVAETSEIQEVGESSSSNKKAPTPLERETWTNSVRTIRTPIATTEEEQGSSKPKEDEFLKGKKVLVVDDSRITSSIAARKLKKMGASEVIQCHSGKEAVRLVEEWFTNSSTALLPFDYIFMDCQMPEMDGYEATREIRKIEREYGGVHIPIIAVSGHDRGSKEAKETIEAGMDAFLEKNMMNPEQLVNIIRDIKGKMSLT